MSQVFSMWDLIRVIPWVMLSMLGLVFIWSILYTIKYKIWKDDNN